MGDKKDKEIMLVDEQTLWDKVYTIRGQKVMLDFDLAEIYGYTTMAFNQQVKRHYERFPKDFMFSVSPSELSNLSISQNVISIQTAGVKGGRSKPIHAFTEQSIYMLMTVLRGPLVEVLNLRSK